MICPPAFSLIEPLEARIAPAALVLNLGGGETYKNHAPIFQTTDASDPFGANFVGGSNTYYVKLVAGDVIKTFAVGEGYKDELIRVKSGTVIAFFTDGVGSNAPDNAYETGELTGLSMGKNASVIVKGSIDGDIVGNYNDKTGKIVETPNTPDLLKWWAGQSVGSITVDNVHSMIFGGAIKNVTGKVVNRVLAGNAADGLTYDFNSTDSGGGKTLGIGLLDKQAGASIQKVTLVGTDVIRAGAGGLGAVGGLISGITLTGDSDGYVIKAGDGGIGNSNTGPNAGAGGAISKIYAQGADDLNHNSPGFDPQTFQKDPSLPAVQILAGTGGSGGRGGAGGSASSIYVGYDLVSAKLVASEFLIQDSVLVKSGGGGDGVIGGAGGSLSTVKVLTIAPNDTTPTDPANEIEVGAGNGGAGLLAGAGGSVKGLDLRDVNGSELDVQIAVHAGDGGDASFLGGAGGSVSGATLLAYHIAVTAGNGSSATDANNGVQGGIGGSVISTTIISQQGIIPNTIDITAGRGGDSKVLNGGAGGSVSKTLIDKVDASEISILAGDGGTGMGFIQGKGGAGGAISALTLTDSDTAFSAIAGAFTLNSGKGGNGGVTGGNGGAISVIDFTADDLSFAVQTGAGGNGGIGNGGNGGAITNAAFLTSDTDTTLSHSGSILTGSGGKGVSGGIGGNITQTNAHADTSVTIIGGAGGAGLSKAAGSGSSLKNIVAFAENGSVVLQAGDAGTGSGHTTAGTGGSITLAHIAAHMDVNVLAGNGTRGGAGGSITSLGYSDLISGQEPLGSVSIQAGNGSSGDTTAGAGGSITTLSGYMGDTGLTRISAGTGAGSGDHLKAGVGGSIQHLILQGGGNASGTELQIQAGDAGSATSAKTGAKGGDVKDVTVAQLGAQSIFRYVIAGDGGQALTTGGAGGTIDTVTVQGGTSTDPHNGDIGVRSGLAFGYTSMGGLFAGVGGAGATSGISGNVTNIQADAIAAIVAGKLQVGDTIAPINLVNKVDQITLNKAVKPFADPSTGSFNNWDVANMVGAIVNPTASTANTFDLGEGEWVDSGAGNVGTFGVGDQITSKTDGFVAAVTYPLDTVNHTNYAPEALLTVNDPSQPASGSNSKFIDNNNQY